MKDFFCFHFILIQLQQTFPGILRERGFFHLMDLLEGLLLFPFHSNPAPTNISWDIKGEGFLSSNGSSGRFTAEGWDTYNGTLPDYMTRTLSTTGTQFVAKLRIDKLKTSDSGDIHHLMVVNQYGNTTYDVQIQHIK